MIIAAGVAAMALGGSLERAAVAGDEGLSEREDAAGLEDFTQELEEHLVEFEMVAIPGGTVEVPDPENEGQTIEREVEPFWIGKHEVRWDEFGIYALGQDMEDREFHDAIDADSRPSRPYGAMDRGFGFRGYPALGMSYRAAEEYCQWLTMKTGHTYRLATEAEWVRACRAGREPGEGQEGRDSEEVGWHWYNSDGAAQPVGELEPNAWGLHDMLGNVSEWAVGSDGEPVALGGSFDDDPEELHCGARREPTDAWQATDPQMPKSEWWLSDAPFVGIRIVREP